MSGGVRCHQSRAFPGGHPVRPSTACSRVISLTSDTRKEEEGKTGPDISLRTDHCPAPASAGLGRPDVDRILGQRRSVCVAQCGRTKVPRHKFASFRIHVWSVARARFVVVTPYHNAFVSPPKGARTRTVRGIVMARDIVVSSSSSWRNLFRPSRSPHPHTLPPAQQPCMLTQRTQQVVLIHTKPFFINTPMPRDQRFFRPATHAHNGARAQRIYDGEQQGRDRESDVIAAVHRGSGRNCPRQSQTVEKQQHGLTWLLAVAG